jgi:copper chaperone CopZ
MERHRHPASHHQLCVCGETIVDLEKELTAAGVVLGVKGVAEVETALDEADLAKETGKVGVADIAEGAALMGGAESAS